MKLISLKMSVSALMLTIVQSGYCVSSWFVEACRALNRTDPYTSDSLIIKNNPDSLRVFDGSKADFLNECKKNMNDFIPKGVKDPDKEAFQEKIIKDMLSLTSVTGENVQDSFKNTIVSNFYKNIGWLGRSEAVYKEVTEVTTVFANSCVPAEDNGEVPATLAGRIGEFLDTYLSTSGDVESKKTALTTLLSGENLTALGADELDDTYYEIKGRVDAVEGTRSAGENNIPPERTEDNVTADQKKAIYNGLSERANKIRTLCLEETKEVGWNRDNLNNLSKNITGNNASDRAESLRKALYNGATNDLELYLNLFGYWKIDTNQADQQEFLQKIQDKVNVPGDVENAVYSTFGEEYETLLRYSDDADLARQKKLVDAVSKITSESTDDQKAEAVFGSIETLDNVTADKVGVYVEILKRS